MNKVIKMKKDARDIGPTTLNVDEFTININDKYELKKVLDFYQNKKVNMIIEFDNKKYQILKYTFNDFKEIVLELELVKKVK
jgi:hypothetical protein